MPSEPLRTATNKAGGLSNGDGDASVTGEQSEPEYIYIESVDETGEWQIQYRIGYTEAKTILTDANKEANSQQVEIVQGIAADYSQYQVLSMTVFVVLVFGLFATVGAIAVRTLVKSLEVRQ